MKCSINVVLMQLGMDVRTLRYTALPFPISFLALKKLKVDTSNIIMENNLIYAEESIKKY